MTARLGMIEYKHSGVKGSWNESHSVWTTDDGDYTIVRRCPKGEVPGAWIARRRNDSEGTEVRTYGAARRFVAEERKRDAGIFPEPKVGPVGGRHEKA